MPRCRCCNGRFRSVVENAEPKGFGANHNQASRRALGDWFCVVNPDIQWCTAVAPHRASDRLQAALALPAMANGKPVGLYCPEQVTAEGIRQDYARTLPAPGFWRPAGLPGNAIPASCKAWHRASARRIG